MRMVESKFVLTLLFIAVLGGATSTALLANSDVGAAQPCTYCNIVDEGIWNQDLINRTVYFYNRDDGQFYPATVTDVYWSGEFRMINWYEPRSGRRGHDYATRYYSYRNMQNFQARSPRPGLPQPETQERNGWLASCVMARADNAVLALLGWRACCQSTAARRYGPDPICL
jgi:hypothetical protein